MQGPKPLLYDAAVPHNETMALWALSLTQCADNGITSDRAR